jgi:hypothetical protein
MRPPRCAAIWGWIFLRAKDDVATFLILPGLAIAWHRASQSRFASRDELVYPPALSPFTVRRVPWDIVSSS